MYTELTSLRKLTINIFNNFDTDLEKIVKTEGFIDSTKEIMLD